MWPGASSFPYCVIDYTLKLWTKISPSSSGCLCYVFSLSSEAHNSHTQWLLFSLCISDTTNAFPSTVHHPSWPLQKALKLSSILCQVLSEFHWVPPRGSLLLDNKEWSRASLKLHLKTVFWDGFFYQALSVGSATEESKMEFFLSGIFERILLRWRALCTSWINYWLLTTLGRGNLDTMVILSNLSNGCQQLVWYGDHSDGLASLYSTSL